MMDRLDSLSIQNDVHGVMEMYLDKPPSAPPEDIAFADGHLKLSLEDVDIAATIVHAYLGMGCDADGFADMRAMLRAYYLEPERRAGLVQVLQ